MENDKDENKIYTAELLKDSKYNDLFEEIKYCVKRPWNKKNKNTGKNTVSIVKHPNYRSYSILDFKHFYKFLEILVLDSGKSWDGLKSAIDSSSIRWRTFDQGRYRPIALSTMETGICTTAKYLKIPLISLLARFLEHCETNKIRLYLHIEYKEIIDSFLNDEERLVA